MSQNEAEVNSQHDEKAHSEDVSYISNYFIKYS